ncbi:MAG: hypothetical protein MUE97_01275 [Phycisphaerales bacterium]|nr:hypothetical protein [Phycisphaerales bacterium]
MRVANHKRRSGGQCVLGGASVVAMLAGSALAQSGLAPGERILKNDRFPDDVSTVADAQMSIQAGFDAGEIAAAILPVPASLRPPIKVKRVQIFWASTSPQTQPNSTQGSIVVYSGSVLQPNAILRFDSEVDAAGGDGLIPVMTDGFLNEFDFGTENITLTTRPDFITVGLRFGAATNQSIGPSVCSDRPPGQPQFQTPGRNALYGTWPEVGITQTQWFQPLTNVAGFQFGVSGNLFMRAIVQDTPCVADIAGPNQQSNPDGVTTADDIIVFLGRYFANDPRANIAGPNQSTIPDNTLTADDIIVFLGAYFAGC